jgi:hypothetical protein
MAELIKGKAVPSYTYFHEDIKLLSDTDIREKLKKDA